ncbi:MAG: hypothetical protein HND43_11145 [Armatimonadetes bacterium]|uniref:ParE-like toxin domain-containing protein n=1 Tax=Candidatus Nitrosymbiomonas proteolyticus TaxID=2608984 RepID=A0A809RGZ8_9BACT|nr:hypothetical protein [Armatimonadota bacterium]MCK6633106.1 hypothetical protein [Fimbriimonadaceae bacterium]NOG39926.1 hypothetical protein [Armatimonadota bacterium]NUM39645.1 hypothetical protein [Armatimonadota bacterium]BBO23755.1 conserved hypothetical protein [Candidatus Nitrosymbiomonas proteolyticus]
MAVRHRATKRFWKSYETLPEEVREAADRAYALLKVDPSHRSLRFKEIEGLWSARVGRRYRALAVQDEEDFIWVWIGTHAEYDRLIRTR